MEVKVQLLILLGSLIARTKSEEIDLISHFEVEEHMPGITPVPGVPYDVGRAFSFGSEIPTLTDNGEFVQRIASSAMAQKQLMIVGSVQVSRHSAGTLFAVEAEDEVLLSLWMSCYKTCKVGLVYQSLVGRAEKLSFHRVSPLMDGQWHKFIVHIHPHQKKHKCAVDLYVDCELFERKKAATVLERIVPSSVDGIFSFAQLTKGKGNATSTWKGALQSVKFVFEKNITELTRNKSCVPPKPLEFATADCATNRTNARSTIPEQDDQSELKFNFALKDVMAILVQIQKSAQTREDTMRSDLQKLRKETETMKDELFCLRNLLRGNACPDRTLHPGDNPNSQEKKSMTCQDNPCYSGVGCKDTPDREPRFKCDPCPLGMTGDGIDCLDLNECLYAPCSPVTTCQNLQPGYRCSACPAGYTGKETIGAGIEHAQNEKQECVDIDECADGSNGGCALGADCINFQGGFRCACRRGFVGDPDKECRRVVSCSDRPNPCGEQGVCIPRSIGQSYQCKCRPGYAGNGIMCGQDTDHDGLPDKTLNCYGKRCTKDNCPTIPNTAQRDSNGNGVGDVCEFDADDDGVPNDRDNCIGAPNKDQKNSDADDVGDACDTCQYMTNSDQRDADRDGQGDPCDPDVDGDGIINFLDNCVFVPNAGQENSDYDLYGDACDNCRLLTNDNQEDADGDGFGDACDKDDDKDKDGVEQEFDNCPHRANSAQLDTDGDGRGDDCDDDVDNDGVLNELDNCLLVSNRHQEDRDGDGVGDACQGDFDQDGVSDKDDSCVQNANISRTDFSKSHMVILDLPKEGEARPLFRISEQGDEVTQITNNKNVGALIVDQVFQDVEFSGTVFVNTDFDNDIFGLIFGYQGYGRFYLFSWKQTEQVFWEGQPFRATAKPVLNLKRVITKEAPSSALRNALWHTGNSKQAKVLWRDDSGNGGWKDKTAYRWELDHSPQEGIIRLKMWEGQTKIVDTGEIYDRHIRGGRVGLLTFSQKDVLWSALSIRCPDKRSAE